MAYASNRCGATRYRAALSNTASKTDRGIYNVTLHRQRPLAPCLSRIRHEEKLQRDRLEWQSSGGLLRKKKQKMKSVQLHSASAQTEADSADQSHASSHLRPGRHLSLFFGQLHHNRFWLSSPFCSAPLNVHFPFFSEIIYNLMTSVISFLKTEKNCNETWTFFIVP